MTTYLGKSCSFGFPRVPFVNCRQFMYLVISLLVLRAGCGIWLYQSLIIAYLFTFRKKTMSNFDIMNWVKELKIKNFDGDFNKDIRQWASNCGIINLDSNNGPETHWTCYVDSFYFDPFGLPPPENIFFLSNDTILYNIKKRYLFFVVTFVFFSLKNSKMVIQFTTFCIKF